MKRAHRGFLIIEFKERNTGRYQRVYKKGRFMQTANNLIDAKRLIDFCVDNGVRGWK